MSKSNFHNLLLQFNSAEKKRCPFPTGIARINLRKLESNLLKILDFAQAKARKNLKLLVPVKANAYGSGMLPVALFLEKQNLCQYFGVAHTCEAFELRETGIQSSILVMGQTRSNSAETTYLLQNQIEQTVSDISHLQFLNQKAKELKTIAKIHLLVDTGMGRCGVLFQDYFHTLEAIKNCQNVELKGVMTHFAVADSLEKNDLEYTKTQIAKFRLVKKSVEKLFPKQKIIFHTSNSGGVLENPESIFDMIRTGIALYGYPEHDRRLKLEPIMELFSQITLIKKYPQNYSIGYGRTYQTQKNNEKIAIVPIGYGDGLNRLLSNQITPIVNGKKRKSVGRISMDQFAIAVDENVKIGDKVILIGKEKEEKNDASQIASQIQTISYEVICNLGNSKRIRHEYVYV